MVVDEDTAEGWGCHTATEGCFYKRGSSLIYMWLLQCSLSLYMIPCIPPGALWRDKLTQSTFNKTNIIHEYKQDFTVSTLWLMNFLTGLVIKRYFLHNEQLLFCLSFSASLCCFAQSFL